MLDNVSFFNIIRNNIINVCVKKLNPLERKYILVEVYVTYTVLINKTLVEVKTVKNIKLENSVKNSETNAADKLDITIKVLIIGILL